MIDRSVARPGLESTTQEQELLDRLEEEIARLREKRPHLEVLIDRAAGILVTHLSCPKQRVIVVRISPDGRARFLVNGSGGAVYAVDPVSWSCSCPDFHRSGLGICKHGLACYVLWRAGRPPRKKKLLSCNACGERFPSSAITEVTEDDRSLSWFPGDRLCDPCLDAAGGIA